MNRIDSHQHFWSLPRGDYHWLSTEHPTWGRDFGPADLAPELAKADVSQTILVQAAWTTAETNYMLGLADATVWVAGVIGWIDFEDPSQADQLARFAAHPKLLGVRPMVQEIADDNWVMREKITWAFDAIQSHDLIFEALGFAKHAKPFLNRLLKHPELRVVINHGMKPEIAEGHFDDWAQNMRRLANETSAFCKLSGLLTEAKPGANADDLRRYTDHLIEVFGPDRLMWGSDWPVLTIAQDYQSWVNISAQLLAELSVNDREKIWAGTATKFYRLGDN